MMPLSQSLRRLCSLGHLRSFLRGEAWQGPTAAPTLNAVMEPWMHRSGCEERFCCGSTAVCAERLFSFRHNYQRL